MSERKERDIPAHAFYDTDFVRRPEARMLRIMAEYLYPETILMDEGVTDTVTFFGSARVYPPPELQGQNDLSGKDYGKNPGLKKFMRYYNEALELSRGITEWSLKNYERIGRRVHVITGGGPGIMEAANRGADLAGGHSIGLNIQLPHEQSANPYISPHLNFNFHYFFMRKYWFLYYARALVVFPGGFGTLDELFETLTLQQTGTIKNRVPVFLYGAEFWDRVVDFDFLAESGLISNADLNLFRKVSGVDQALHQIIKCLEDHFFK